MNRILALVEWLLKSALLVAGLLVAGLGFYGIYDSGMIIEKTEVFAEDAIFAETQKMDGGSAIGWIRIDGTEINQPIVQGADNDYYLRHNYRNEYSVSGSVFLDYRNAGDFSDDYMILYGHRMSGHLMFGDIKLFADKAFFDQHRTGILRMGDRMADLKVLAYVVIGTNDEIYLLKNSGEQVWSRLRGGAMNIRDAYSGGRLLILSTCDATSKNKRNILVAEVSPAIGE